MRANPNCPQWSRPSSARRGSSIFSPRSIRLPAKGSDSLSRRTLAIPKELVQQPLPKRPVGVLHIRQVDNADIPETSLWSRGSVNHPVTPAGGGVREFRRQYSHAADFARGPIQDHDSGVAFRGGQFGNEPIVPSQDSAARPFPPHQWEDTKEH